MTYNPDDDDATISQMLFTSCALYRARCELAFAIAQKDPRPIRGILLPDNPFVRSTDDMCEQTAKKVMTLRKLDAKT